MNLSLTEEQMMIQDMARKFADSELAPVAAELDETQNQTIFLNNLAQLTELGFMGLNIKAEYGGVEAGSIAFSLAITELARACASTAVTTSVTNMVAEVIQAVGNEQQKQTYLPRLCSGEYRAGAFCLTESGAGSDPGGMKTTAELDGDSYVLNGNKLFIGKSKSSITLKSSSPTAPVAPTTATLNFLIICYPLRYYRYYQLNFVQLKNSLLNYYFLQFFELNFHHWLQ